MIRIVTDTDANLPRSVLEEFGIVEVPMHIIFDEIVIRERVDVPDEEVYARIRTSPKHPTTSQPSAGEFMSAYQQVLAESPSAEILSIHVSSKMSGTLQSARQAADLLPDAHIQFFDSLSASLGQGLMVYEAARLAKEGAEMDDILSQLEDMRQRTQVYFVLNSLEDLARSGRIGKASHLVGNLLEIRPILSLQDGVIGQHSRHRTWARALDALRETVLTKAREGVEGTSVPGLRLAVVHILAEEQARELADELLEELAPEVFLFDMVGPGLGVHTGPGTLGVAWYVPKRSG